jgi:hypothetical protein
MGLVFYTVCNARSVAIAWRELQKDASVSTDMHPAVEVFAAGLYALRAEATTSTPAG